MYLPPPGYEPLSDDLSTLLSTYPPPFIYIRDLESPLTTFTVVSDLLASLVDNDEDDEESCKIHYARVDMIQCFTPRLMFETIIHSLVGWEAKWEDGCPIWNSEAAVDFRWNENMDTFLHGLRAAYRSLYGGDVGDGNGRFVIVVERPESLKENHPELLVPFTRLTELARIDLCVIFISQVEWENVRPPLGASPDPYYIDVPSPSKEDITKLLISRYPSLDNDDDIFRNPYHPSLSTLYSHFITTLCDVCYPFTHDPHQLQYIAAARWVGFIKPLLDEYKLRLDEEEDEHEDEGMDTTSLPPFEPPSEDLRIRLIKFFTPSLSSAMESLLPRLSNAADWSKRHEPPKGLLRMSREEQQSSSDASLSSTMMTTTTTSLPSLPRMSKFILIASFLASMNPAKSDIRMFGRMLDDKTRRKRRKVGKKNTKSGAPSKIPQRLLGPTPFPIDRMLAILGALIEENDIDNSNSSASRELYKIPGEHTDLEISRIGIYSAITEIASMSLIHRTSPSDRLDGPPMFKCAVSYDVVLALARELDVGLLDLLWDPM